MDLLSSLKYSISIIINQAEDRHKELLGHMMFNFAFFDNNNKYKKGDCCKNSKGLKA